MSVRKIMMAWFASICAFAPVLAISTTPPRTYNQALNNTWAAARLADQLGWVQNKTFVCGGYYLEDPFLYPLPLADGHLVEVTSNQGVISQKGTSYLEDHVTINRHTQQVTANKAYVYRDAQGRLATVDLMGDVHLREPNTLIIAKNGQYFFKTQAKSLDQILYRTVLLNESRAIAGPNVPLAQTLIARKISNLTAWGEASRFEQTVPRVYEFKQASYSTCPPINPAWKLKGSHIVLDKNTGRGYATHARFYVKDVPVFYFPYLNFSIDRQRKTGLLKPTFSSSNRWGPYILLPFYWNMAPNYDMTITPGILTKRGIQFTENFRYLSPINNGNFNFSILPNDREFSSFQENMFGTYKDDPDPIKQAELRRLLQSSKTRRSFYWRDDAQFNQHWSSKVDFNYVSDDYYLTNLGNNLNEVTNNQLLQEAEIFYKAEHWEFTGRLQAYQTMHAIDQPFVENQYRRLPQLILTADYPNQFLGLEYFIRNEATAFDYLNTPGTNLTLPIGERFHTQPGISLPIFTPSFYINPRAQFALTSYHLKQTLSTNTPTAIHRALPIVDINSGLAFSRETTVHHQPYHQTFEPQIYYVYVPYRNQSKIPTFDTTVNTLTYDQLFHYNRFSGIDRIGDANQLSYGATTRFIDQQSGLEKIRIGVGEIVYFSNRLVTLCDVDSPMPCSDNPDNPSNKQRFSPISGIFNYYANPSWSFTSNALWDPSSKQLVNTSVLLRYQTDNLHIINFGYTFARSGDVLSGVQTVNSLNNLKVTDISGTWKIFRDVSAMARWSQNWNNSRLQNLLFGLQYDTCCWAVRVVGGRAFLNLDPHNNFRPTYSNQYYLQFALKGLGNVGPNPSGLLSNITGYNPQFGQEF